MPSTLSISVDEVADTTSGDISVEKSTDKTLPGENSLAQGLYQVDQDNAQLDAILAPLAAVTAETSTAVTNAIGTTANGGVWVADFTDFTFPTLTTSLSGIDCSTACSGNTGTLPICVRITVGGQRVWYGKMTSAVTSTTKGAGCFYTFSTVTDASTEAALFDGSESHLIAGTWDFTDTANLQLDMISATTTADSSDILNSGTRAVLTETSAASASVSGQSGKSSIGSNTRTANVNGTQVAASETTTVTAIDRWTAATIRANQTIAGTAVVDIDGCFITGTTTPTGDCLTIDDVILVEQFALPTVAAVASPPSVTGTSPANGATGVVLNPSVTVTFSEAMDTSSITASTFKLTTSGGTAVNGTITTGSAGTTAILTPTTLLTASTTYTGTVTNGVTDAGGTPPTATYTWSFTTGTEVDSTVPSISSTSPASGATRVAVNASITATFSEAVNSSTVTTSSFTVAPTAGGSNVAATVAGGTTSTLTPTSNLSYSTSYTAGISTAVQDTAGNSLTAAASWAFTTIGESGKYDPLFSSNGWYSESFSTTGSGFDQLQDVVVQSDGKIVAVGTAYNGTTQDVLVVRYSSDGSLDSSFSSDGYDRVDLGGNEFGQGVALQSDGKIVVAVWAANAADTERDFAALRYTTSGVLDTTYGGGDGIANPDFNGGADTDTLQELVINSSDQAILCGQIGGRAGLARLTTAGALDTTFATNGTFSDADFNSFYDGVIDSDGKIIGIGESGSDIAIARFSANGALDTSYSVDGRVTIDVGSSTTDQGLGAAIQSDGKLVVVGHTNRSSSAEDCVVVRLGTTGSLDTDFGTSGIFQFGNDSGGEVQDICYGVRIHSGGRIVVSGASAGQTILARLTSSGTFNTTFDTDGLAVFTEGSGGTGLALDSNEDYVGVGSNSDGGTNTFILRVIQ